MSKGLFAKLNDLKAKGSKTPKAAVKTAPKEVKKAAT